MLLVFATSDKGGTGRSVTSSNVVYRSALTGKNVCYLDFDFGSPTAGAIFNVDSVARGTTLGGLHSYLRQGKEPHRIDVWSHSERSDIRRRPMGAGRLTLFPGDESGGEFAVTPDIVRQCRDLFLRLAEEFDVCLVDLSSGRSAAVDIVLAATGSAEFVEAGGIVCRWLIFHRWTRQHIIAAHGLVRGDHGILAAGVSRGHDRSALEASIRYVRTAVVETDAAQMKGMRSTQIAWLHNCDLALRELASRYQLGRMFMIGATPLDPMLQWREQLITDDDVWATHVANPETVKAFSTLAEKIVQDAAWEGL